MPIISGGDEDDCSLWITVHYMNERIGAFQICNTNVDRLRFWCAERWGLESPAGGINNVRGWSMWGPLLYLPDGTDLTEFKLTWL